jgi:hypothetical protein
VTRRILSLRDARRKRRLGPERAWSSQPNKTSDLSVGRYCHRATAFGEPTVRLLLAESSPSTRTFQCPVKTPEQPLGARSSTPGPDPYRQLRRTKTGRSTYQANRRAAPPSAK